MQDVMLEEFMWPCVHYAIKRTGSLLKPSAVLALPRRKFTDMKSLQCGDIVVWENRKRKNPFTEMTAGFRDGVGPVVRRFKDNFHVAVYEGSGFFSDVTIRGNKWPTISVFRLDDWNSPDEVIAYSLLIDRAVSTT